MQYGAPASLIHVALSCGTSAYLNSRDFDPCFVHSLTCTTIKTRVDQLELLKRVSATQRVCSS